MGAESSVFNAIAYHWKLQKHSNYKIIQLTVLRFAVVMSRYMKEILENEVYKKCIRHLTFN